MHPRFLPSLGLLVLVFGLAACDNADPERLADLSLTAASSATAAPAAGDAVTFTVTLVNTGPDASTGAAVEISATEALAGLAGTATAGQFSGTRWTVPALAVGDDAVLTLTATVATAGAAELVAEIVEANEDDPSTAGNSAAASFSSVLRATAADVYAPSAGIPPAVGGAFTFYSLRENRVVLQHDNPDRADSATVAWDLAFRGTTILTNGGSSGPGQGQAQVVTAAYETVAEAPEGGYASDAPGQPAVPTGSGNGWYNYNGATNLITPIPGRTIVVKTADGRYATVRILSYYRGNPPTPNGQTDAPRYYTFEYVFQPDGSRRFE